MIITKSNEALKKKDGNWDFQYKKDLQNPAPYLP